MMPEEMRAWEREAMASGMSDVDMIEVAALRVTEELETRFGGLRGRAIGVGIGPGNNGGDGWAVARMCTQRGAMVFAAIESNDERWDGAAGVHKQRAGDIRAYTALEIASAPHPEAWIDAWYGLGGLNRMIGGGTAAWIKRMNGDAGLGCAVVAIDIPSGLNALTGAAGEICVNADATVTFESLKPGHILNDGIETCGDTVSRSIDLSRALKPMPSGGILEPSDIAGMFPKRKRNSHKGTYGHALIIAGSLGMSGAAVLCAQAALRGGAGLITIACPEEIIHTVQTLAPCAMATPINDDMFAGKTCVAIGPGLSRAVDPRIIDAALTSGLPAVIDADALNIIATRPDLHDKLTTNHIITPHPGEMARLVGAYTDPFAAIRAFRANNCAVLLKGCTTMISQGGYTYYSTRGTPGMATGGSGDVLTGLIAAFMAQGLAPLSAGCAAAFIHGASGERAAAAIGAMATTALDILAYLPGALMEALP